MRGRSSTGNTTGRSAVVFLSRSGNTRVVAGQLQRAFKADSFELKMATPWPDEYEAMVAWASRLKEAGTLTSEGRLSPDGQMLLPGNWEGGISRLKTERHFKAAWVHKRPDHSNLALRCPSTLPRQPCAV